MRILDRPFKRSPSAAASIAHTVFDERLSGAEDRAVLAAAVAEDRVLVTLDRDFTNVLIFPPESTAGIAGGFYSVGERRNLLRSS